MTPRARVAAWTAALIAIAIGGSNVCATLTRFAHAPPGIDGPYSFSAGMRLPVAVVNDAQNAFPILLGFLIIFAALGYSGWRLACALRDSDELPGIAILAAQSLIGIALSFFAITFSSDPYAYVIFARAHGVFRLNPYTFFVPLGIIRDTVLQQCIAFYGDPPPGDNYGPTWTLIAGLIGRLEANSSLWLQFWTQRIAAVAGAVACTAGVMRLLVNATPAARRYGAALFAFHPLVLWESAVGGHNDFLMLACAVWACAMIDAYPVAAGALLGVAIGIKYVPVLLVPILVIRALQTSGPWRAILCGAVALVIPAICFVPFWSGLATLLSLEYQGATLGISPTWLLAAPFLSSGIVDMAVAPSWHGSFLATISWGRLLQLVLELVVIGVVANVSVRIARGASLAEVWRIVTAFVWTLPSVNVWYVAWLTPAVALGGRWATYAWWFGALAALHYAADTGALTYVPGSSMWLALLTIVFMGVPVLIAYRSRPVETQLEQAPGG